MAASLELLGGRTLFTPKPEPGRDVANLPPRLVSESAAASRGGKAGGRAAAAAAAATAQAAAEPRAVNLPDALVGSQAGQVFAALDRRGRPFFFFFWHVFIWPSPRIKHDG